ncbi:helix-turn-helix domain-containing protein [Dongia mobilis]|jgi:IclR family mhp operon transcriptional activator|uniref:IclR family transcriptional regulator n=1 Tax=Dongia sp. TaxID=1977262 RepID=UPI0026F18779
MIKTNRSLERGLLLLDILTRRGPNSLATLARHAELPKATAYRLLLTLVEQGWIYRRHNDGRYVPTLPSPMAAAQPALGAAVARLALPHLVALSEATGLAADLTWVIEDGVLEVIESTRQPGAGHVDPKVAGFRPSLAFSAPGRALLAASSDDVAARHLQHLMRTDSPAERHALTSGQLASEILATRQRGYGVRARGYWPDSSDYGAEPMDIAVALAIKGHALGCLSLVWPSAEHTASEMAGRHLVDMRGSARKIASSVAKLELPSLKLA